MTQISNVKVIGRTHSYKGQHKCTTPTLISTTDGFKMFYDFKGSNKGLFVNPTNWFWKPSEGFYGSFEIRKTDLALMDFYDFTTFDEELTGYVDYLAGA